MYTFRDQCDKSWQSSLIALFTKLRKCYTIHTRKKKISIHSSWATCKLISNHRMKLLSRLRIASFFSKSKPSSSDVLSRNVRKRYVYEILFVQYIWERVLNEVHLGKGSCIIKLNDVHRFLRVASSVFALSGTWSHIERRISTWIYKMVQSRLPVIIAYEST